MEIRWLSRGHSGTETAVAITRQNDIYEALLYFYQRVNSFDAISKKWHHQSFKYKITWHGSRDFYVCTSGCTNRQKYERSIDFLRSRLCWLLRHWDVSKDFPIFKTDEV